MQCGPSFTTNKRAPLISLAVRSPEAAIGKIRSASPWITSVGTSIRVRSLRKSSYHVGTQARLAVAEAPAAGSRFASFFHAHSLAVDGHCVWGIGWGGRQTRLSSSSAFLAQGGKHRLGGTKGELSGQARS